VAQTYRAGIWTLVEVVELRANGGHVFMGVSERDAQGAVLAKTSAVIWQSSANLILPEFERATGAQLAPGIKLLVRARPVFKPLHGFSLEVDAIDSEYTLGDLEARKREIRERLLAEGVFASNRQLPAPWDYTAVLVVAPEGGAGLGDFQAEADRLESFGVCRFTYVFSRFQGEGAAREICDALQSALTAWTQTHASPPDAVVILRGGGAVNDLAWLNDYDLARLICDCAVPVLTGIGHERDSTVLDEVAHSKFDTPSKVIAGIEQRIVQRAAHAKANFEHITQQVTSTLQTVKAHAAALEVTILSEARHHLAQGSHTTVALLQTIRQDAVHAARSSSVQVNALLGGIFDGARRAAAQARVANKESLEEVTSLARQQLREAVSRSEALLREISGQGPERTLQRGFAVVRSPGGKAVTRARQARVGTPLEIQFHDGRVVVTPFTAT
jgi:exodeoxyribonuclease VII large subunit